MRTGLLYLLCVMAGSVAAQEGKTYTVNSIQDNKEELIRDAYRYPQFTPGVVHFKDGRETKAYLNYHRLYDQLLFLTPKGDTLALGDLKMYKFAAIGTDTFYVQNNGFLERLTHYAGVNLARKGTIVVTDRARKGAYGTYSTTAAIESRGIYNDQGGRIVALKTDENLIYNEKSEYFLSDAYNNFSRATKKNFYDLFRKQEKKLREYLDTHKVDFFKEKDLLQLLAFLQEG